MTRRSIIKSLLLAAASPKIIAELDLSPVVPNVTAPLFRGLNFLTPEYANGILAKYGTVDFLSLMEAIGKSSISGTCKFSWYEGNRSEG